MADPTRALWTTDKKHNKVEKSEAEWKAELTPEQFHVARKAGTERAFTGPNWDQKADGTYKCVCCGQPLFEAQTKYDSGTGWPSFYAPVAEDAVEYHADKSLFSTRTEVVCSNCDAHLGHVFPDGPAPTGLRYCMNGLAMDFDHKND
jgi:peptide-methionine (R)-S-oxide reductase